MKGMLCKSAHLLFFYTINIFYFMRTFLSISSPQQLSIHAQRTKKHAMQFLILFLNAICLRSTNFFSSLRQSNNNYFQRRKERAISWRSSQCHSRYANVRYTHTQDSTSKSSKIYSRGSFSQQLQSISLLALLKASTAHSFKISFLSKQTFSSLSLAFMHQLINSIQWSAHIFIGLSILYCQVIQI